MTAPTSLSKHQPRVYFELTDIKKEIGDEDMIEIKIKIETSGLNHWTPPQNTHKISGSKTFSLRSQKLEPLLIHLIAPCW